jgi:hypothetical protein
MNFFRQKLMIFLRLNWLCKPYFQGLAAPLDYEGGICCQAGTASWYFDLSFKDYEGGICCQAGTTFSFILVWMKITKGGFVVKLELNELNQWIKG